MSTQQNIKRDFFESDNLEQFEVENIVIFNDDLNDNDSLCMFSVSIDSLMTD